MKNITILLLITLMGCTSNTKEVTNHPADTVKNQDNTDFKWLLGVWERSMKGDESMNHFEAWSVDSFGLKGTGTTIIDETVTEEQIWIFSRNDSFFYKAHPQQNETATLFHITEIKDSFFRSENEGHDFPKYIEYYRQGDSLYANIGDESQRIAFKFRRQDERSFR